MENKMNGFTTFAVRHPFITMLMFGKACESLVTIIRGHRPAGVYNINTSGTETEEEEQKEEPEVEEETAPEEMVETESEEEA